MASTLQSLGRCLCTYSRLCSRPLRSPVQLSGREWRLHGLATRLYSSDSSFSEPGEGYRYLKSHEWVSLDGNKATVGISNYAQEKLGDVVFVELPELGDQVTKEEQFGVLESVKAAADLYSPMSGEVVEINTLLADEPEQINKEPYGKGWIMKVEVSDKSEYEELLTPKQYEEHLSESI